MSSSNEMHVDICLGVHPAHVKLKSLHALLITLEGAIKEKTVLKDFGAENLTNLAFYAANEKHPWWPMIDEFVHVKRKIISPRVLLFMLKLRVDLNKYENDWSMPENQPRMEDILGGKSTSPWEEVWTREPILFWTLSQVMKVLLKTQEIWRKLRCDKEIIIQFLDAISHRIALLTSFKFDGVTLDEVEYRTQVQESTSSRDNFVASVNFMWDVTALLVPMYRDLKQDHSNCTMYTGPKYITDDLRCLIRRIVYRMHGDDLPGPS